MQDNEWNQIYFAGAEYTHVARLEVTPEPDTVIRVFMVFRPVNQQISLVPQKLRTTVRKGFSVVEWGGSKFSPIQGD